jgi:hypothetical protein
MVTSPDSRWRLALGVLLLVMLVGTFFPWIQIAIRLRLAATPETSAEDLSGCLYTLSAHELSGGSRSPGIDPNDPLVGIWRTIYGKALDLPQGPRIEFKIFAALLLAGLLVVLCPGPLRIRPHLLVAILLFEALIIAALVLKGFEIGHDVRTANEINAPWMAELPGYQEKARMVLLWQPAFWLTVVGIPLALALALLGLWLPRTVPTTQPSPTSSAPDAS